MGRVPAPSFLGRTKTGATVTSPVRFVAALARYNFDMQNLAVVTGAGLSVPLVLVLGGVSLAAWVVKNIVRFAIKKIDDFLKINPTSAKAQKWRRIGVGLSVTALLTGWTAGLIAAVYLCALGVRASNPTPPAQAVLSAASGQAQPQVASSSWQALDTGPIKNVFLGKDGTFQVELGGSGFKDAKEKIPGDKRDWATGESLPETMVQAVLLAQAHGSEVSIATKGHSRDGNYSIVYVFVAAPKQ